MSDLVGLIPAAGRGVRAYPYTQSLPKCLLEVDGVPILQRNLELMRDQLRIREAFVVVGHCGDRIREFLGDGAWLGMHVETIENDQLDRELSYSLSLGARRIQGPCLVLLSDELYLDSNHAELLDPRYEDAMVTCGLVEGRSVREVRKNYTAQVRDDRILSLTEKPRSIDSPWMGVGTYRLSPEALRRLERDLDGDDGHRARDWTTWIGELARSGECVRPFFLSGGYVNVNDREALNRANQLARERDFDARTTSLVYVVDEAEDDVEDPVRQFASAPEVDEVVVTARRPSAALDRVREIPKVRVLVEESGRAPMGDLVLHGLDAARGDILITAYSDDSYSPRDLAKLLVYVRDADLVVGTRTTRQMIEQGSNMRGIVRAAHLLLAKGMEVLWWRFDSRFTDVGCVYRAIWRSTYRTIRGELSSKGVEIFPEMVIEVLRARRRVVEIPVNYYARDPEVEYVPTRYQTVGTFFRVLALMLRKRFQTRRLQRGSGP
jgi:NDP-sugar pyrophosphorylase family protein